LGRIYGRLNDARFRVAILLVLGASGGVEILEELDPGL
jgi:hypothetical protein